MLDERWIRALHVEALREEELHAEREPHVLFQASTIGALLDGAYDGDLSFAELAEHGDLGLGTLNGLDGEMIALDGALLPGRRRGRDPLDGASTAPTSTARSPRSPGGEDAVRGRHPLRADGRGARSTGRSRTRSCWRGSTSWSRPAPPPARSGSTAASSSSAPARCRARAALPAADRGRRRTARLRARRRRRDDARLPLPRLRRGDRGRRLPPALHRRGPRARRPRPRLAAAAACGPGSTPPTTSTSSCRPRSSLGDPDLAAGDPRRDRPGRAG